MNIKKIFMAVTLLMIGVVVFAQQPTSAQTKSSAQDLLNQSKSNSTQFESTQSELLAANVSNTDAAALARLRYDIEKLENLIKAEHEKVRAVLDSGRNASPVLLERSQNLINRHKAKIIELAAFSS